jgi:hypothetical protein
MAFGYHTGGPTSFDGSAVQILVTLCFRAGDRMNLRGDGCRLDPGGLDKLAGQSDGATLVALGQLVWQRSARLQPRPGQVRSASACAPACDCVGCVLTV